MRALATAMLRTSLPRSDLPGNHRRMSSSRIREPDRCSADNWAVCVRSSSNASTAIPGSQRSFDAAQYNQVSNCRLSGPSQTSVKVLSLTPSILPSESSWLKHPDRSNRCRKSFHDRWLRPQTRTGTLLKSAPNYPLRSSVTVRSNAGNHPPLKRPSVARFPLIRRHNRHLAAAFCRSAAVVSRACIDFWAIL